ncbi:putative DNA polymerase zeta catalytic subunit [Choanephora cucurbitarum]|nr:putative DNA polymerase zeta catalytic subunit [Choanephora cucurbitarum]
MNLAKPNTVKDQHIAAIVLVKGVPFYGYHVGYQPFLKIYLTDPQEKQAMLNILQTGAIMNTSFQPFEAHLNFELQFLMDYNLYGMDWIHIDDTHGTDELMSHLFVDTDYTVYTSKTIPVELQSDVTPRESYCELELDVTGMSILNRHDLQERSIHVDLEEERQFQAKASKDNATLVKSLESIWKDEASRQKSRGIKEPKLKVSQTEQREPKEPWLAEPSLRRLLNKMIFQETHYNEPEGEEDSELFEAEQQQPRQKEEQQDDEDYFSIDHSLSDHDIIDWLKTTEKDNKDSSNTLTIEYEQQQLETTAKYQPRKLDFLAEDRKVDSILQASPSVRKRSISDIMEETEMENKPFAISDVPPIKESKSSKVTNTPSETKPESHSDQAKVKKAKTPEPNVKKPVAKQPEIKTNKVNMLEGKPNQAEAPKTEPKWNKDEDHPLFQKVSVLIPLRRKRKRTASSQIQIESSEKQPSQNSFKPPNPSIKLDLSEADKPQSSKPTEKIAKAIPEAIVAIDTPLEALSPARKEQKQPTTQLNIYTPEEVNEKETQAESHLDFSSPSQNESDTIKEFIYNHPPPKISQSEQQKVVYKEPFFSKASDQPQFPFVFEGKEFRLPTSDLSSLREFKTVYTHQTDFTQKTSIRSWIPIKGPPSTKEIKAWAKAKEKEKKKEMDDAVHDAETQLDCPTYDNIFNFKLSATKPAAKVKQVRDHIDFFSVELHVNTREQLLPNPEHDPVSIVFWCLQTKDQYIRSNGYREEYYVGAIVMNNLDVSLVHKLIHFDSGLHVDYAETEEQLFDLLIEKIRYYDPEMLVGYETQSASWGYLIERGAQLGYHLVDELSRAIATTEYIQKDQWGYKKASSYRIVGRHMLNIWRLMRNELTLTSYTLENVAYHLLHYRVPHYSYATLTSWYNKGPAILKYRLFKHYMRRIQLNLEILEASQVISRMCESARVYGIDFYAVMTRGSQYNVESVMFRIAKPENFMLISPSRAQVASQRSLEVLPLVMEPVSQFYSSPMAVLDFQSLYPSIMIAYNYCYSTCLGRIRSPGEDSRFGVLDEFELQDGLLDKLKDFVNISPNGVMFVKPEIRKSLLAKMLNELLDTRAMVKKAMKDYKDDSGLLRMLDAKQLSLKLLANVTYGYTSASYSGRMPSVEIADSIVSTGRETLEKAIRLVNETKKWGARVVYGDTDSMFVYFPGKTKEEAFRLGREIAETVTRLNPAPVKLKFEKIYHPSVLLAKKRYVGFKYENENDATAVFEAKGIETVRRDGTAATQKILESSLKILFRTQDMSELKEYLCRQWTKILSNRVSLQDFIIAKEVRMGTYSARGGPNGAVIAQAQIDSDTRAEPQYGERVPYVVVYRGPNARLKDKVVRPEEALTDSSLRLDAEYYIRKQIIPPLARIFNLMDVLSWYESMPRSQKAAMLRSAQPPLKSLTRIDQYYSSSYCLICQQKTDQSICAVCQQDPIKVIYTLSSRQHAAQTKFKNILQTCERCTKIPTPVAMMSNTTNIIADSLCHSLDCPVYYQRLKAKEDVNTALCYDDLINDFGASRV